MTRYATYLLLLTTLLTACTESETPAPVSCGEAIGFSTYTAQMLTRANPVLQASPNIPDGGSIGIYAYYHQHATWATDATPHPNFMWNQKATRHEQQDMLTYDPLKYWPNENSDKVSFMAYFPYRPVNPEDPSDGSIADDATNPTGLVPLLANDGTGLPTFRFTVNDDDKKQVDFLVSDLMADLPYSRDTEDDPGTPLNDLTVRDRVYLYFRHALAKVEFRVVASKDIAADIESFHIDHLEITNIRKEGTLTPVYDSDEGTTTLTWGDFSGTTKDYVCTTYKPYLLLPQPLDDDAMFCLSYKIYFKSDKTAYRYDGENLVPLKNYVYENTTATLRLNEMKVKSTNTALTEWLPGHHYVYTIRLTAQRIEYTGQVVEWGDEKDINISLETE